MTDWLDEFLDPENFEAAWQKIKRKRSGPGVDGETIDQLAARIDQVQTQLIKAIAQNTYQPLPLKPFVIPKKNGEWRHLAVPTLRDRLVQQALLSILHQILEPQFESSSFAYRPGKSYLTAVRQIRHWHHQGYEWVLDADLVKYFGELNHQRLIAEVAERVHEPKFLDLVQAWISVGTYTKQGIILPEKGLPQGAIISPILANVYLDDFDEAFLGHQAKLVRFSDDFVLLARSKKTIYQLKDQVEQLLSTMGLTLHPDKTSITSFEKGFKFLGHTFVGDLIIENRAKPSATPREPKPDLLHVEAIIHADPPTQTTAMAQALLEAVHRQKEAIPSPLYVVLGYRPHSNKPIAIDSEEISWLTGMATLYLVHQGSTVRKQQERIVIQRPQQDSIEIPLAEVQRILVFGNIQLTTPVITLCLEQRIPVIYLSQMGEYKGHLWNETAYDLTLEIAQFQRCQDQVFQLTTACQIVKGKLWNSRQLLLRLNRNRQLSSVATAIQQLEDYREQLSNPLSIDQIRGYEGTGAASYFAAFGQVVDHPDFHFKKRTYHPPLDPVNAMLSFGYTLLLKNVFSMVMAEGLNPHLGNLHGAKRPKAYLAFDLMEEFRSPIVDTLIIKLINQKIIKPSDFTWPNEQGGVYLNESARRVFLKEFEARIVCQTSYPDLKEQVSYRRAIQLQIQRYTQALLGRKPYEAFRRVG
ncbi:MAG: CRISPR-associated endonuclease Cas1 [Acaryochloris sp. CRU_2_0]|nr:CRISPR-associated endonuclease Cas1 [Acaryochloris sp. CRU_2_0]